MTTQRFRPTFAAVDKLAQNAIKKLTNLQSGCGYKEKDELIAELLAVKKDINDALSLVE